jgi:serine/threonine protein kinase
LRESAEGGTDVSRHRCSRHPDAAPLRGHCPVCLLEAALPSSEPAEATVGSFTIQVPLGESEAASVFVVREDGAVPRLLRLKRWHTPAPAGFVDGFERLRAQLQEWRPPAIVLPVTAWVDAHGRPSVVTDFRQGMPLLESVRSGWLHPDRARSGLRQLQEILDAAHARGLAHGSVVPNNVFSARPDGAPYLLDFGFGVLLSGSGTPSHWAAADDEGLVRIQAQLQRLGSEPR